MQEVKSTYQTAKPRAGWFCLQGFVLETLNKHTLIFKNTITSGV